MRLTVAVSGASGFVGRHVVAALARRDVDVVCLQRTAPTGDGSAGRHRVAAFDINDLSEGVYDRIGRPDVLIHLAWGGLPNYRSAHHVDHELPAQQRLLDALIAGGLTRLLVAGTCFEYGMRRGELTEAVAPEPANAYATAKDRLRRHLQSMQRESTFTLTWARLFYLYGEGQAASSLYAQLTKAIADGDAEFPMSGGAQVRDFMPIEEAADDLVALALDARDHGVVNVCSGVPVTVKTLVERWIAERGSRIVPALGRYPYPDHEPMAFWGSRLKLDGLLANPTLTEHQPRP